MSELNHVWFEKSLFSCMWKFLNEGKERYSRWWSKNQKLGIWFEKWCTIFYCIWMMLNKERNSIMEMIIVANKKTRHLGIFSIRDFELLKSCSTLNKGDLEVSKKVQYVCVWNKIGTFQENVETLSNRTHFASYKGIRAVLFEHSCMKDLNQYWVHLCCTLKIALLPLYEIK